MCWRSRGARTPEVPQSQDATRLVMKNAAAPLFRRSWGPGAADRAGVFRRDQVAWSRRSSSSARGYDRDWRELRAAILDAEPFCRECRGLGRQRRADCVDHIQSVRVAPERRLDPSNCPPLRRRCYN
jgi:hypothetical protein